MIKCPACEGENTRDLPAFRYNDDIEEVWVHCPICDGYGEITRLELAIYKARCGEEFTRPLIC